VRFDGLDRRAGLAPLRKTTGASSSTNASRVRFQAETGPATHAKAERRPRHLVWEDVFALVVAGTKRSYLIRHARRDASRFLLGITRGRNLGVRTAAAMALCLAFTFSSSPPAWTRGR
jgi:hypothetical protein